MKLQLKMPPDARKKLAKACKGSSSDVRTYLWETFAVIVTVDEAKGACRRHRERIGVKRVPKVSEGRFLRAHQYLREVPLMRQGNSWCTKHPDADILWIPGVDRQIELAKRLAETANKFESECSPVERFLNTEITSATLKLSEHIVGCLRSAGVRHVRDLSGLLRRGFKDVKGIDEALGWKVSQAYSALYKKCGL